MGQSELNDWIEFYKLEPFGEIREEQRNGLIASLFANTNRDRKAKPEPYTTDDFMYKYEAFGDTVKTSGMKLRDKFKMFAAYHNAVEKQKD